MKSSELLDLLHVKINPPVTYLEGSEVINVLFLLKESRNEIERCKERDKELNKNHPNKFPFPPPDAEDKKIRQQYLDLEKKLENVIIKEYERRSSLLEIIYSVLSEENLNELKEQILREEDSFTQFKFIRELHPEKEYCFLNGIHETKACESLHPNPFKTTLQKDEN